MKDSATQQTSTYSDRMLNEQIRLLYNQTWSMLAINVIVGGSFVYAMQDVTHPATLFAWFSFLILTFIGRLSVYFFYVKNRDQQRTRLFARLFVAACFLAALAWGSSVLLFFKSGEFQHQLVIFFIIAGMGAGSVASMYSYRPVFLVYFLTSTSPIVVRLLMEGDTTYNVLAGLFALYIVALIFFASRINRTFLDALRIRFENAELVTQLRDQKEEAVKANQAKSKFLAAASHDLRQPLHALTLYTSVLSANLEKAHNKKLIKQISHSIEALQSLFNALLDISRLEAGTLVPERRHFRLEPLLERVSRDFDADARAKGIHLRVESTEHIGFTDSNLLEQILRNYIANAVKYTTDGEIVVYTAASEGSITVQVADTGIGIPEDQLEAIFAEFYQLRNPERDRSKGLGLGLAIVNRISSLLGHDINVTSSPGKGSCFSVTIPAGSRSSYIDLPKASVEWMRDIGSHGVTLAVIDDDVDVRESTEALFTSWGCRVFAGSSPQKVIQALEQTGSIPDAVIADFRLRDGRTGIGAIDLMKARFGDMPALIMTGDTGSESLQAIQNSGIPIINKPVAPAKLRAFIRKVNSREEIA